jgi:hypothetical protein
VKTREEQNIMRNLIRFKRRLSANGPGLIVAVIAMVIALAGGAFAASGGLTPKQKKQVEAIAKKFAGKPGPAGAAGAIGAKGDAGSQGKEGPPGKEGLGGKPGKDGTSVALREIPAEELECDELGGVEVRLATQVVGEGNEVCNGKEGKEGKEGPEGKPWTAGGLLPPGATETGSWAFDRAVNKFEVEVGGEVKEVTVGADEPIHVAIPFFIPLAKVLSSSHVTYVDIGETPSKCQKEEEVEGVIEPVGNVAFPRAAPGELCVFQTTAGLVGTTFTRIAKLGGSENSAGANRTGAMLVFAPPTENAYSWGTFAVTGCDPTEGATEFPCP